ncbi:MAG: DNA methylase [Oscillospiraceae bacterium]|nr:DNA methylase [Oscillospiraceae bacterium]
MTYICIDLKSFYASVECAARGLDPLDTNLVVADAGRTEKTICLAVTPSLKALGIPGRPRLFEVIQKTEQINAERSRLNSYRKFTGSTYLASEFTSDNTLKVDFIVAPPQMSYYMEVSASVYKIYLRYIAPEDIHVYSVDEVFIDVTNYLPMYKCNAHDLAMRMIRDVLKETGITATAGIGTNMFLAKIAMDIVAKKMPADKDGVRISELDEMSFRKNLWNHTPLTDFWRFGPGISSRLNRLRIHNLGELARLSERNEDVLYREFGKNAELIIDHAWGYEPCKISDIKAYRPENHSISQGQVLPAPYSYEKAMLIVKEMTDQLSLDLVRKSVVSDQLVLTVCYDHSYIPEDYGDKLETNHYGKSVPKSAHGSMNIGTYTSSSRLFTNAALKLYKNITDRRLLVRRIYVVANHVIPEGEIPEEPDVQYSFFHDSEKIDREREEEKKRLQKERNIQNAILSIKAKYGKNAVLKGMNFEEGGTAIERNGQVGGHRA